MARARAAVPEYRNHYDHTCLLESKMAEVWLEPDVSQKRSLNHSAQAGLDADGDRTPADRARQRVVVSAAGCPREIHRQGHREPRQTTCPTDCPRRGPRTALI